MAMSKDPSQQTPAPASSRPEIAEFIERVRALGPAGAEGKRGRLVFALDATMSRQPTWDLACALQADMLREAVGAGGLDIQLVYLVRCAPPTSQQLAADSRVMPLELTHVELETAARACRALARQEEQAAKRIDNPGMRGPIENTAKRAAALAEKFEAARKGGPG